MVWSIRNYVFKSRHYGWLLYAGNSGSILSLDNNIVNNFNNFKSGDFSSLNQDAISLLKKYGVIIDITDDDLLDIIITKSMRIKCSNSVFSLSICPSNSCNFNCSYCFEDETFRNLSSDDIMNDETISNLIVYIKNTGSKKIHTTFFGGEPLLGIESIIKFHKELKKTEIELEYEMITNGYLLNQENIEILDSLPISLYQITIDGFEEEHNKRRPHLKYGDSYSKIINNLYILDSYYKNKNKRPIVHIRVNIDKTNKDVYHKLYYEIIKMFQNLCIPYASFVHDKNSSVKNINIMSKEEKVKFILDNYNNYGIFDYSLNLDSKFKLNYCIADSVNSLVIDSNGNTYKCLHDIGNKEKILFNINSEGNYNELLESRYMLKASPFFDNSCKKCFLLFSCFGGCPFERLNNNKTCLLTKYSPKKFFEMYYERICSDK